MTLAIDVAASLSGTSLTLTLTVGSSYGTPVDSFQIDTLKFDVTATYTGATPGPGYTVIANLSGTPPSLSIGGFISDGSSSTGAGSVLVTLAFTVPAGSSSFDITEMTGALNLDNSTSGFAGTMAVPCFAAGTLIRTPSGEVAVEALAVGDLVTTALGAASGRVSWVGHRRVDCRAHARPHDVQPIRIAPDALEDGVPRRALVLSPDHALYLDGVLIPVRYLLNGATIVQLDVARITYFHVELDRHDVLLAEGAPAETYLDTGNRAAFAPPGSISLAPPGSVDFARSVWREKSCAALVVDGPVLAAVRRRLLERALLLGHATDCDPGLRLLADGQALRMEATPSGWRVCLPNGSRRLHIRSRAAVPAQLAVAGSDHRRLGVAVAALSGNGVPIALDDARLGPGWHAAEAGWRWTDGDAALDVTGLAELELTVAMTPRYWLAPEIERAA